MIALHATRCRLRSDRGSAYGRCSRAPPGCLPRCARGGASRGGEARAPAAIPGAGRRRGAINSVHCLPRKLAITSEPAINAGSRRRSKSQAGWAKCTMGYFDGGGLRAMRVVESNATNRAAPRNHGKSCLSSTTVYPLASVFSNWSMVEKVCLRDSRSCAQ